jgi:hypothetical protein
VDHRWVTDTSQERQPLICANEGCTATFDQWLRNRLSARRALPATLAMTRRKGPGPYLIDHDRQDLRRANAAAAPRRSRSRR